MCSMELQQHQPHHPPLPQPQPGHPPSPSSSPAPPPPAPTPHGDANAASSSSSSTPATTAPGPSPAAARSLLLAWMREVACWLQLRAPSLQAAVDLLDRFLQTQPARPPDSLLQLLALTCLAEATNSCEAHIRPSLQEWASFAADETTGNPLYEMEDFTRMRQLLLTTLGKQTVDLLLASAKEDKSSASPAASPVATTVASVPSSICSLSSSACVGLMEITASVQA